MLTHQLMSLDGFSGIRQWFQDMICDRDVVDLACRCPATYNAHVMAELLYVSIKSVP